MDLLSRALDILEFVCMNERSSAEEISDALKIPKSSVYRLLTALCERDYVRHAGENAYEPGPRLLMLQGITVRQNRLLQVARPHLRRLAQRSGQTAHLAVRSSGNLSYVDTVVAESGISIQPSPSSPLHCTSLGKVLLAFLPPAECNAAMDRLTLERRTPNTITSREALLAELEQTRSRGYAFDNEEFQLGVRCVGAPVRGGTGEVVAATSISGLAAGLTSETLPGVIDAVLEAALAISQDLGYRASPSR